MEHHGAIYSRIGNLSFAIFLLAQGKHDIPDEAQQELVTLFRTEHIPEQILNDYIKNLETGNAGEAFFDCFVPAIHKAISIEVPMISFKDKLTFFELGIAFTRFSAKPDEDEHEIIRKVASQLELEIPDYSELLVDLVEGGGIVTPPRKWFEGSDGASRAIYSRIGNLSFAIFLLAQGKHDIPDEAQQELVTLFRTEHIPEQILNDYIKNLETGNAKGAFRGFVPAFSQALPSEEKKSGDW